MKTIYKYTVPITWSETEVEMPEGAQILSADVGDAFENILIWAVVDTNAPLEVRRLEIRGTGHDLGEVGAFIATLQDPPYVGHVFEAAR